MASLKKRPALNIAAWAAQLLVAGLFGFAGFLKLTQPIAKIAAMMPWTGQLPPIFVRTMGVIDLAGAIGITLPAILRIAPGLVVPAAAGCVTLQICAIVFHLSRGEGSVLPLNIVLIALSAFVLWVRTTDARIARDEGKQT